MKKGLGGSCVQRTTKKQQAAVVEESGREMVLTMGLQFQALDTML